MAADYHSPRNYEDGRRSLRSKFSDLGRKAKLTVAVLGAVGLLALCTVGSHLDRESYVATVTDKTVKRNKKGDDKYLVFTKLSDGSVRVFEDTDSFLELKFNSSDIHGELEIGKTYRIGTYGLRIPVFSWYENIISVSDSK